MTKYVDDRSFTNFVHQNLAVPILYNKLGWKEVSLSAEEMEKIDIQNGIDYLFHDASNKIIKVQERFRDSFYAKYNDCTLRYRRDQNSHVNRRKSEFYKVEADFLVYGITNGAKFIEKRNSVTGFIKYTFVDLRVLMKQIDNDNIILKRGINRSYINDNKLIAPIKENKDSSSSFVAFDVYQLHQLFGVEKIIRYQKGFIPTTTIK